MITLDDILRIEGFLTRGEADTLRRLAKDAVDPIVEIGSYKGRSTLALALGSFQGHRAPVYAVDPHLEYRGVRGMLYKPRDKADFLTNVLASGLMPLINIVHLPSAMASAGWFENIGLLFIDGSHEYRLVKHDFLSWGSRVHSGVVALHDSDLPGVQRVIQEATGWRVTRCVGSMAVLKRGS